MAIKGMWDNYQEDSLMLPKPVKLCQETPRAGHT